MNLNCRISHHDQTAKRLDSLKGALAPFFAPPAHSEKYSTEKMPENLDKSPQVWYTLG